MGMIQIQQHQVNDTLDEIRAEYASQQNIRKPMAAYNIHKPIMIFWIENSQKYPLLRPLADILHAVPSNQCCTERGFSC